MLPLSSQLRFYLYALPTDMRNSFDGLCGIVTNALMGNPTNGDVYMFINRRRDRIKLLVWDRSGFWLLYKRLEKGTFQLPTNPVNQPSIELSYDILLMLLEGIDITTIKRRSRYQRSDK
jgi:transposase